VTSGPPVLVVDDDAVSRHVLATALRAAALESVFVSSGAEALRWVEEHTPCLVLLDLVMPEPDGYEVMRTLRGRPETAEVPVVVLTALDAEDEVTRAFEAGADDFLRKPFRAAELVARIRGQLRLRQYVEAIAQRERDAQVVLELSQTLASSLDMREILQAVVRRVAEVTQVDRCSIVLAPEKGDVGYVVAANDDSQVRDLPLELNKYPEIRQVLRSGSPLVIDDVATHPLLEVLRRESRGGVYASVAIVPIAFEDRPLGVLFLRSKARAMLGERVVSLARTIANTTAVALRNAHILKSLREQTNEMSQARFEAERRLRLTERYADFFESAADGITVIDHDGQLLFSNARAREIAGVSAGIESTRLRKLVAPDDWVQVLAIRDGFRGGLFPQNVDLRMRRPDGQAITVNVNFSAVRGDNTVLATFRDVTVERATAEEFHKTKSFLESVIQSSADAIVSADLEGKVLLFNGAAERLYGYRAAEVIGVMSVETMYPAGVAREIMRLVRTNNGRLEAFRTDVLGKGGERVPVSLSAGLIDEGGRVVGSVGVFTDLRERIRMESRLVAAQEELKMREKQSIVAELAGAAAHELNQPLTSVMGYAELLRRRLDRDSSAYSAAEVIFNEAERMAEIVRKIGKITRYETKSYVGHAKILDLDKASDDAAEVGEPPHVTRGT
jgi:PAS domain S-box-containing protein